MFGQMTAGSWIYIGSQGIVQGTYETFVEMGRQHYGGSLAGRWILTAGLGGMGGAQPMAATMAGASCLAIECRPSSIEFRRRTGYVDLQAKDLDDALAIMQAIDRGEEAGVGGAARQCRRGAARAAAPRRAAGLRDRPDLGARSGQRLSAGRLDARRLGGAPQPRSGRRRQGSQEVDGGACARHARVPQAGRADGRLRQQPPPDGARRRRRRRLQLPGLRAGLCAAAVLPRHRAVPLGRAVGRSRGHLSHRREGEGADAGQRAPAQLARHGAEAHQVPGPAGAHLLGRAGRPASAGARLQRHGGQAASSRRRS